MEAQQELDGPEPTAPLADDQNVNPGQSFLGKFAGKRRKEAFFWPMIAAYLLYHRELDHHVNTIG